MNAMAQTILEISIMSTAIVIITMLIRCFFAKKMPLVFMTVLWSMVLVRLLLPITITSPVHFMDLLPEKPVNTTINADEMLTQPLSEEPQIMNSNDLSIDNNSEEILPTINNTLAHMQVSERSLWQKVKDFAKNIPLEKIMLSFWVLGALVVFIVNIIKTYAFKKKLLLCRSVTDTVLREILQSHCQRFKIKQHIKMFYCDFVAMPSVYGWIRPRILLPSYLVEHIDKESISVVLLHEVCHIKRNDIFTHHLWLVAKALHWFNPLVWLAYRMVQEDMELCCDRKVIKALGNHNKTFLYVA